MLLGGGLQRPDLEDLLTLGVTDPPVREREDAEDDEQNADDSH